MRGGDYFGYAVAAHGNTVVATARSDDDGAVNSGAAYVYTTAAPTGTLVVDAEYCDTVPSEEGLSCFAYALSRANALDGAIGTLLFAPGTRRSRGWGWGLWVMPQRL